MKTFWQLILELTAYQKLEKDSWAKAAARKAALPNPTVKTSLPWGKRGNDAAGWYHPTEKSFLFKWSSSNYHITQIVKSPQVFGVTTADLKKVLEKYCKGKKSKDIAGCAAAHERSLLLGEIDILTEVADLALDKGWAMVTISSTEISIRANKTDTHKGAVREILEVGAMQGKTIRIVNEKNPSKDLTFVFIESAEKFLHS